MTIAFLGTHIPLLALIGYVGLQTTSGFSAFLAILGVTLAATLAGTGLTLFVLDHLLRPVLLVARSLRVYRTDRRIDAMPVHFSDEAGALMADASRTLNHLDRTLAQLELTDETTGLGNRPRLAIDIGQRLTAGKRLAICAVRLTSYARLLDTLDLATAERAIRTVAARLTADEAGFGQSYRVAGADLVVLVEQREEGLLGIMGCEALAQTILAAVAGPLALDQMTIDPLFSVGVALAPDDAAQPDVLIDHALAAVAAGKGPNTVTFHSASVRQANVKRLQFEQELRRALNNDEFVLHYQPVIDLEREDVTGAEALIRWQHPERGLLSPGLFLEAAEAAGLTNSMGLTVLRKACSQIARWNHDGRPGMRAAINLSARQFLDADLVAHVAEAIDTSRIKADQLEIELTETVAMADHDHTRAVFKRLRDLGVSIAIDDFGTGYASMSYLRKLPFDKLKIDREFVANVGERRDSQAICSALVTLSQGLGLKVLAEGTEAEDEVRHLWALGCKLYQGYFFAKPVAADQFATAVEGAVAAVTQAKRNAVRQLQWELASRVA